MQEGAEVKDYYKEYSGPDIYRVSMKKDHEFHLRLPKGYLDARLIDISNSIEDITIDDQTTGWLYTFGGEGQVLVSDNKPIPANTEDLFYLRPGASFKIKSDIPNENMRALLVTKTDTEKLVPVYEDKPPITKLKARTENEVDWVGNWLSEIEDSSMHVARDGSSSTSPLNPSPEIPLHKHGSILEVYFIAEGRSIMNVSRNGIDERVPMRAGDMFVLAPNTFHGVGSLKANRVYSGPYKGLVIKIPANETPITAGDKSFQK